MFEKKEEKENILKEKNFSGGQVRYIAVLISNHSEDEGLSS